MLLFLKSCKILNWYSRDLYKVILQKKSYISEKSWLYFLGLMTNF